MRRNVAVIYRDPSEIAMSRNRPVGQEAEEALRTSPIPWFAMLERARLTGDVKLERTAREQLRRLGVTVVYVPEDERDPRCGGDEA